MAREVKFKARRCFEGQWEEGPVDDGKMCGCNTGPGRA